MKNLRCLSIILILMCIFDCYHSITVEELQLLQCNVDIIQDEPIKREEQPSNSTILVTSEEGLEYACILPPDEEEDETDQTLDYSKEIGEMLQSMESGPCISKETGWWTENICFGSTIRQYHVTNGHINSYVIILGVYDSDYDWSNDVDQNNFTHGEQRYFSQYYFNGTECGFYSNRPNGVFRSTEVRLYCEEGVEDYIYSVQEPEKCTYVIKVHTSRLCSIPGFKPQSTEEDTEIEKPVPCYPLLDEEQFVVIEES